MAITRRTAHFALLAELTEAHLADLGYRVDPSLVDVALNARTEQVAELLGVSPRSALVHAQDSSALTLAETIVTAIEAMEAADAQPPTLRVVR